MKAWKIRRRTDGAFSKGTMEPRFTKDGKTWGKRSHAIASWRQHVQHARLTAMRGRPAEDQYTGLCEIVEYDLVEAGAFEPEIGGGAK